MQQSLSKHSLVMPATLSSFPLMQEEPRVAASIRPMPRSIEAQEEAIEAQEHALDVLADESGTDVVTTTDDRLRKASEAVQRANENLIEHALK